MLKRLFHVLTIRIYRPLIEMSRRNEPVMLSSIANNEESQLVLGVLAWECGPINLTESPKHKVLLMYYKYK